ncbi:MAG: division/cell wall cluster transcriptional repressor MraZ [Firmicutes bacterium]|nr:division/cell wall cluster transcriptional repressor MraZ [Bacillota bacterium]
MFCNKYSHTIDDKGRMIIPTEYRDELIEQDMEISHRFYVTTNLWDPEGTKEPCLCLWPETNYRRLRDRLAGVSESSDEIRRLKRKFFSDTQSTTLDKQGRVLIDPDLKRYAGIERNVMLVGMDERIEVWNRDAWQAYMGGSQETNGSWNDTLKQLGF